MSTASSPLSVAQVIARIKERLQACQCGIDFEWCDGCDLLEAARAALVDAEGEVERAKAALSASERFRAADAASHIDDSLATLARAERAEYQADQLERLNTINRERAERAEAALAEARQEIAKYLTPGNENVTRNDLIACIRDLAQAMIANRDAAEMMDPLLAAARAREARVKEALQLVEGKFGRQADYDAVDDDEMSGLHRKDSVTFTYAEIRKVRAALMETPEGTA